MRAANPSDESKGGRTPPLASPSPHPFPSSLFLRCHNRETLQAADMQKETDWGGGEGRERGGGG